TLTAVFTLALGIGANTAIYSVVNAVLLRPLPYPEAERLVVVASTVRRATVEVRSSSYPDFADWRDRNTVFEQLAAFEGVSFSLSGNNEPERVNGELASADYFQLLRVQAAVGRTFLPEEDRTPDAQRVVLLGYGLWQRRFGGQTGLVGQTIQLSDGNYTVVGIMPAGFRGVSDQAELWLPMMMVSSVRPVGVLQARANRWHSAIARLKAGVTLPQAQAEMDALSRRLEETYPASNANRGARVTLLREQLFGGMRLMLWILLGAVGCVLLVACANVANLLLQRAAARQKETAIRLALGATPRRLMQQLLTESFLLAGLGGALGVALAWVSLDFLLALSPVTFPTFVKLRLDASVLGFSLSIAVLTGVIFGLMPALQAARPAVNETLKDGGRGASSGLGRSRLLGSLVVSEIALALALLIGAGLLIRSLQRLQAVDPGFNSADLLAMSVSLPAQRYQPARLAAFGQQLREWLQALPAVQSVAVASDLPLNYSSSASQFELEGQPAVSDGQGIRMYRHSVTPQFFSTLGIPLVKGRDFTADDHANAPGVAIVSEAVAQRYWPNENPLGKRLRPGGAPGAWLSIVGVAREVKYRGLPQNPNTDPDVFFPLPQAPRRDLSLVMRSHVDPASLVAAVRGELKKLDPDLPVYSVTTMAELVADRMAQARFSATLLGLLGALALALAAVGNYSVMSYAVTQRTRELGVRMALGAQARDMLRLIIGQGMKLALTGVLIGLGGAFALTRMLQTLLFGVTATDPLTFAGIAVLLTFVALMACYLPARRATKVDPLVALRQE
ncbi:MAG: ABC transporter permease, partial [Blastocatellia bacterium]